MKKAYTLVEILVTAGIIAGMAVLVMPSFRGYGRNIAFSQKVNEIESIINEAYVFSRNPEKDISGYQVSLNSSSVILSKVDSAGATTELKTIKVENGDRVNGNQMLICNLNTSCFIKKSDGSTIENGYNILFFEITDSTGTVKKTFYNNFNPFKIYHND